ncbi:MAG: hypothetical protein M1838_003806 [Thelocarpon superellum]|nr:MAG: hypothetical protein M1838_003806 [Thelocarpon superellum]
MDREPPLRTVNFSTPRIQRQPSRQSLTVSDDYHSLAERASISSFDDRTTVIRWQTPPPESRPTSSSYETLQKDQDRMIKQSENLAASSSEPVFVIYDEPVRARDQDRIEPIPLRPAAIPLAPNPIADRSKAAHSPARGLTPGTDDTPYIQYAINQLTREPEPPLPPLPPLPRAPQARAAQPRAAQAGAFGFEDIVPNADADADTEVDDPPRGRALPRPPERPISSDKPEIFIPVDEPEDARSFPALTAIPAILHPVSLMSLAVLCLLEMAALVTSVVWSQRHHGVDDYDGDGGRRYFIFEFLPQIVAAVILVYILSVQTAMTRVMPFLSMASHSARQRSSALQMDLFPTDFVLPRWSYFRAGHVVVGTCFVIFWLSLFTLPLQASLFQAQLLVVDGEYLWRWVTVRPIAELLAILYGLVAVACIASVIFFFRRRTGLKWDPTCLADLIPLIQRSNSLADYRSSETFSSIHDFGKRLAVRSDRLGYWRTRDPASRIFYALGEEGAPLRTYSLRHGKVMPIAPEPQEHSDSDGEVEAQAQAPVASSTASSLQAKIYSPAVRYRFVPWFLRDRYLLGWIVVACALFLAFVVASFVKHALAVGFYPLLGTTPNPLGFSPGGFLYSFVPCLIGLMLFLAWQSVDMRFRALQPFAHLAGPQGTSAEKSLLLDYPSCLPLEVTVKAAALGDFRVAWISFLGLLCLVLPIIAGGLFFAVYVPEANEVRMVTSLSALYTLVAFLALYLLSLFLLRPGPERHLPHDIRKLAEVISFIYQSPLLTDPAFRHPRSKVDLVTRLLSVAQRKDEEVRYAFGVFRGRDGKEHLGVDRLHRPGADMIVTTGRIR